MVAPFQMRVVMKQLSPKGRWLFNTNLEFGTYLHADTFSIVEPLLHIEVVLSMSVETYDSGGNYIGTANGKLAYRVLLHCLEMTHCIDLHFSSFGDNVIVWQIKWMRPRKAQRPTLRLEEILLTGEALHEKADTQASWDSCTQSATHSPWETPS